MVQLETLGDPHMLASLFYRPQLLPSDSRRMANLGPRVEALEILHGSLIYEAVWLDFAHG